MEDEKFDNIYLEILKEKRNLIAFFESIFGFLNRRTDFYCKASTSQDHIGLQSGVAERIIIDAFQKYKPKNDDNLEINHLNSVTSEDVPYVCEEIVFTEEGNIKNTCDNERVILKSKQLIKEIESANKHNSSESYNGATYENYSWSQNITDIDVVVNVPQNLTSKDIFIDIQQEQLTVKLKKDDTIVVTGELSHKIKPNETIWSLGGSQLQIHLEKTNEVWWDRFYKSEPILDIQKLDCTRPMEDLSSEAQATIDKLRWDSEQKLKGLPTSDQIKNEQILRKAWNAEGSPFQGQPFDPSRVEFNK